MWRPEWRKKLYLLIVCFSQHSSGEKEPGRAELVRLGCSGVGSNTGTSWKVEDDSSLEWRLAGRKHRERLSLASVFRGTNSAHFIDMETETQTKRVLAKYGLRFLVPWCLQYFFSK